MKKLDNVNLQYLKTYSGIAHDWTVYIFLQVKGQGIMDGLFSTGF